MVVVSRAEHSLRVGWRNLVRVSLMFVIIISLIYCVSSRLCTLFRRISDSRFTWIHDFEENLTESVGPVLFSTEYLIYRHVRTDGQTHGRINLGGAG